MAKKDKKSTEKDDDPYLLTEKEKKERDFLPSGRFRRGNQAAARGGHHKRSIAQHALNALYRATAGEEMDKIAGNLISMANGSHPDASIRDQISAIKVVLDRVLGKPKQEIDVNKKVTTTEEKVVLVREALGLTRPELPPSTDEIIEAEFETIEKEELEDETDI